MKQRTLAQVASDLKRKWKLVDPALYWGDNVDVRYYLCHRLQMLHGMKILDIGCGPGIVLSVLDASNDVYGVDIAPENIRYCRTFVPGGKFLVADMHRLPFPDNSFDAVLYNAMLPLALDKGRMIAILHSVLKPEGLLLLTTHNRDYYEYRHERELLTIRELEGYLKPYFDYKIRGFNPLPRYPFFVPNMFIGCVPFIWNLIAFLSTRGIFSSISCGIYVEAVKKKV